MRPELEAAIKEAEARFTEAGIKPDPPSRHRLGPVTSYRTAGAVAFEGWAIPPYGPGRPGFVGWMCGACGQVVPAVDHSARCADCVEGNAAVRTLELEDFEDDATEANEPRRHLCGWGGYPRCGRTLERRGLCDQHRAALNGATTRNPVPSTTMGRRDAMMQRRIATMAEEVVAAVEAAGHHPISRKAVASAVGMNPSSPALTAAIAQAEESGRIVVRRKAAPKLRGLYPPGSPTDD